MVRGAEGDVVLQNVVRGEQAIEALRYFGYSEEELVAQIQAALRAKVEKGELGADEADGLLDDYRLRLRHYTYLD